LNILRTSIAFDYGLVFFYLFFRSIISLRDMELFFELNDLELDPAELI
jgi:hypothetical protein